MRQRRHGDPNAEFPPGRPPNPKSADPEPEALRRANAKLRDQIATLTRERDAAAKAQAASPGVEEVAIRLRNLELQRENASLKNRLARAEAKLANDPGEVAEQRQLRTARAAARAKGLTITKSDLNAIRKALHPDKLPHAGAARKAELEAGAKAFNAIKFVPEP